MNDLSKRLRGHVISKGGSRLKNGAWDMMMEAADRIDALEISLEKAKNVRNNIAEAAAVSVGGLPTAANESGTTPMTAAEFQRLAMQTIRDMKEKI